MNDNVDVNLHVATTESILLSIG